MAQRYYSVLFCLAVVFIATGLTQDIENESEDIYNTPLDIGYEDINVQYDVGDVGNETGDLENAIEDEEIENIHTKIIGGSYINIDQTPYQILLYTSQSTCGGSILRNNMVITAKHCLSRAATDYKVRAGSRYWSQGGTVHSVTKYVKHPTYDLALVWVRQPFSYNNNVRAVGLATKLPPLGANVLLSGWGRTASNSQSSSSYLKAAYLPVQNVAYCKNSWPQFNYNGYSCFGKPGGNAGCNGDSGGPVVYNGQLVGVFYGMTNAAYCNQYSIFLNVPPLVPWINSYH